MATLRLPVDGTDPNFNIRFNLDGAEYQFQFRFNDRDQAWALNILDSAGTLIRAGIKIVQNFPLNRQISDAAAPPGTLYLVDSRGEEVRGPPNLNELGTETFLLYVDQADTEAAGG